MKKNIFIGVFLFFIYSGFGQAADSAAVVREVDSLLQVAGKLTEKREFEKALELLIYAEKMALTLANGQTTVYGNVCFQYGIYYHVKGNYGEAEQWFIACKEIREKKLGREHPDYAAVMYRLGLVYYHIGNNYEKSELHFLEARKIQAKTLSKEHLDYALTQRSLGYVYYFTGNYKLAEACYLEALEVREKILGQEHPLYGSSLNDMGNVYCSIGDYKKAVVYYKRNISILEKTQNDKDFFYGGSLMNLGTVYLDLDEYDKAEKMFLDAKRFFETLPNYSEIPPYMSCMAYLGMLYFEIGRYKESEEFNLQAKTLRGNSFGKDHLSYQMSLAQLSVLYWKMGEYEKAALHFSEAADLRRTLLSDASRHFSEKEVYSYVLNFQNELDKHLSFAHDFSRAVPFFAGACYDNTLFHKGFLLNTSYYFRNLNTENPGSIEKLNEFRSYQKLLATEYAKPLSGRDAARITSLEEKANALEKELARSAAGIGEAIRQISWQEARAALRPGEAAIEFVHFNYYKPEPTDSVLYAAMLLAPGIEYPLLIPLFEEKAIEALLPLPGRVHSDYVNQLYEDEALTKLIWSPLEPHLKGIKTVYFSSAGLLHRLHLAALPLGEQTRLSDRFDLVAVQSTRQLVARPVTMPASTSAVVFGAIQYEMDSTEIIASDPNRRFSDNRGLSFSQTDSTFRGDTWRYLKHSEKEAGNITGMLQKAGIPATVMTGFAATEEQFKKMGHPEVSGSPRILHLSTHGYFFPDPKLTEDNKGSAVGGESAFKLSDHPMIRSGLILAGANHAWKTGRPLGNREDGILTAYEISQLDLRNTELVVLSACETGLGHIEGNEGVYGLQRAFKIAGAKTLVMSLWQVSDYETQELMTVFYQKWLLGKMPVRQALQAAQKEMRDKGYEPYYWAGFVVVE